jgi:hypothetical protein
MTKPHEKEAIIIDTGDLRKYRTELPNILRHLGLSPNDGWLYFIIKSSAGENGKCTKSTRTLALEAGMSVGAVVNSKKVLVAKELITVESRPSPHSDIITCLDLWPLNFFYFLDRAEIKRQQVPADVTFDGPLYDLMLQRLPAIVTGDEPMPAPPQPAPSSPRKFSQDTATAGESFEQRFKRLMVDAFEQACDLPKHRQQPRDTRAIESAITSLRKEHPDKSPETLASMVRAFGIWWTHKENRGVKFGAPRPETIVTQWGNFKTWCKQILGGRLPTEETFKDGSVRA